MLSRNAVVRDQGGLGEKINLEIIQTFSCTPNFDERGEFTRIFDVRKMSEKLNRNISLSQVSFSRNTQKFTRRGLHVRKWPEEEHKYVRVLTGSILDLILDCRPNSSSFGSWAILELKASNGDGLYVPAGFAHGIQTLEPETILAYGMEIPYDPTKDIAVDSLDLDLKINWGAKHSVMSKKDSSALSWKQFINQI